MFGGVDGRRGPRQGCGKAEMQTISETDEQLIGLARRCVEIAVDALGRVDAPEIDRAREWLRRAGEELERAA